MLEKTLKERCLKEERKAQYELYKLCFGTLMSVCLRYTSSKDRALELINIGFFKIITNLHKHKEEVPFEAWIRKIMVNTAISEYKKEQTYASLLQNNIDQYDFPEEESEENNEYYGIDRDMILSAMNMLSPMTKNVVNLYIFDGYKHEEIAEMLGIPVGTSKWHLHQGRKELKIILGKLRSTE